MWQWSHPSIWGCWRWELCTEDTCSVCQTTARHSPHRICARGIEGGRREGGREGGRREGGREGEREGGRREGGKERIMKRGGGRGGG